MTKSIKNIHFVFHALLFFVGFHQLVLTRAASLSNPYYAADDIAINCGFSGDSITQDGREWVGDADSKFTRNSKALSMKESPHTDPVPYQTARISHSEFVYAFKVNQGQKFIRLHFHSAFYPGFEKSKAFFTVQAGPFTLLSNFNAYFYSDSLGFKSFTREFCVNFEDDQVLTITFPPSQSSCTDATYAFVNGIEIVSMPAGLYYTQEGDPGAQVVGQKHRFHIDHSTALELVHRLNVGGGSILPVEDSGLYRKWLTDSSYVLESGVSPFATAIPIKYTNIPTYVAPQKIYRTAWSMDPKKQKDKMSNLTWKLPVDVGFRYLLRLHFCELEDSIKDISQRKFSIFINNKTAEACADLIKWGGADGVAMYEDYVVKMEGNMLEARHDLNIALQPECDALSTKCYTGVVFSGIEVFKLSNPDNNLAGDNPEPPALTLAPALKFNRLLFMSSNRNTTVSGLILLITSLNVIAYSLRLWAENFEEKHKSSSSSRSEEVCRRFSFHEISQATNNFDDKLVIGNGRIGKVYKGTIDKGTTPVAVKRLKIKFKQGAEEFLKEIKMLSSLRDTHLVKLIGYCNDSNEMILVYEYMIHGTLADHFRKVGRPGCVPLSWECRLNICIGAAHGLEYLHTVAQDRVMHCDVKSATIMLDENWVAKISDVGLSKIVGSTTNYSNTSNITEGTDTFENLSVYAFGVVLLEVLTGRLAEDEKLEGKQHSLALWAEKNIKEEKLDQIIDPYIKKEITPHCLKVFVEIATKCLSSHPNDRPRMSEVVQRLKFILASKEQSAHTSNETEEETNVSMIVNMPIDEITEGKEEGGLVRARTENKQLDVIARLYGTKKPIASKDPSSATSWWWNRAWSTTEAKFFQWDTVTASSCRRFSLSEINAATNNFHRDCVTKYGGSGREVYRGYLDNGKVQVSIERYLRESESTFLTDVWMCSRLNHPHVVSFVGYCNESGKRILVYKYMAGGSFSSYLKRTCKNTFSWKKRLEICIAAAKGLQYLHHSSPEPIIHGNFNSNSIFLDDMRVAKVSGVKAGTAISRVDRKTVGYMDPKYLLGGNPTIKSDVYSFGVLLLEALSGREPHCKSLSKEHKNIVHWYRSCVQKNRIKDLIDPRIFEDVSPTCLRKYVATAESCLLTRTAKQKDMGDVVSSLENVLELQEVADARIKLGGDW